MKIEMTVDVSEEVLAALSRRAPEAHLRSELVEAALRAYLLQLRKQSGDGDLEIINAHAIELNEEAEDVLSYQALP